MTQHRRPLSIAHVTSETGFSGGEVQVFLLLEGLAKRGHRCVLVCPPNSRSQREARERGIETRRIRIRREWSPRDALQLRRALAACAADLVHLHTGRANWLGGLAAWSLGLAAITTRRMDRPIKRNFRTRFVYGSAVHRVVAISDAVRDRLLDAGVPASMIQVIRSAVDRHALHPQRSREQTRRTEGVADGESCLLSAAALVPRKGVDVLLEALTLLARRNLRPHLWVAGEGPARSRLARTARRRGLAGRVRFLGQRSDVADLMSACDVFVLPSRREGLGVAALEAMALGRPVVASRVGGLAEAVEHEGTGLLVPPDEPAALASALERLLRDPLLRHRLGAAGPARVEAGFGVDRMLDDYERLALEVVTEGS